MRSPVATLLVVVGLAVVGAACDSPGDTSVRRTTAPSAPAASSTLPAFAGGANPPSNVDGGNRQLGGPGYKGRPPATTAAR